MNWNWNSIRTKLITFMIMATIIPTTISMIISYVMTTNSLKERAVVENMNLLYQGRLNLESYLEEMNRSSLTVYSDPDFSAVSITVMRTSTPAAGNPPRCNPFKKPSAAQGRSIFTSTANGKPRYSRRISPEKQAKSTSIPRFPIFVTIRCSFSRRIPFIRTGFS